MYHSLPFVVVLASYAALGQAFPCHDYQAISGNDCNVAAGIISDIILSGSSLWTYSVIFPQDPVPIL